MVYTSPKSAWNTLIQPFLEKKRALQIDAWGKYPSKEAEAALDPLVKWIDKVSPTATETYPTPWATQRHILRATFQTFLANSFSMEFAGLFRGKGFEELEELARSFHFDECLQREGLNKVMSEHAKVGGVKEKMNVGETGEEGRGEVAQLP